jgi:hypothetical protein
MTNTYTPIASVTLSATASEVVFSGLPQTFRDIILVSSVRNQFSGTTNDSLDLTFNGDSTSSYSMVRMYGDGSSALSAVNASVTSLPIGRLNEGNTTAGQFSANVIQIMDYSTTNKHKTVLGRANVPNQVVYATAGRWAKTEAINSIRISNPNAALSVDSTFTLFGVIA